MARGLPTALGSGARMRTWSARLHSARVLWMCPYNTGPGNFGQRKVMSKHQPKTICLDDIRDLNEKTSLITVLFWGAIWVKQETDGSQRCSRTAAWSEQVSSSLLWQELLKENSVISSLWSYAKLWVEYPNPFERYVESGEKPYCRVGPFTGNQQIQETKHEPLNESAIASWLYSLKLLPTAICPAYLYPAYPSAFTTPQMAELYFKANHARASLPWNPAAGAAASSLRGGSKQLRARELLPQRCQLKQVS